jgi:hypothetical protein
MNRLRRLRNSSGIPDEDVKQIVTWIAEELGINGFDIECRNSTYTVVGYAYSKGSSYHTTSRPFAVLRVGTEKIVHWEQNMNGHIFHSSRRSHLPDPDRGKKVLKLRFPTIIRPYQYAQHKGRKIVLANRMEALVYLAAHELRHLWQAAQWDDRRKANRLPMAHGSRGKFSEIDTEAYAIHTLRRWRKEHGRTDSNHREA